MSDTSSPIPSSDVEKAAGDYAHLTNTTVQSFGWENVSVTVKDRESKLPKTIVSKVNGIVKAGRDHPVCTLSNTSNTNLFKANCWPLWAQGNICPPCARSLLRQTTVAAARQLFSTCLLIV
jgi:hypothetical protein